MYILTVNLSEITAAAARLKYFAGSKRSLTRGIAGVLTAGVERGFRDEAVPVTGAAWAKLSPVTLARREKAGHTGKILQVTDDLAASFERSYDEQSAMVASAKEYVTTMHFGAKKGQFGESTRPGTGRFRRGGGPSGVRVNVHSTLYVARQ